MKEPSKVVVFVSDIHAPFYDERAIDLTCKILADVVPDIIFFGGDIVDCYAVSSYSRDPKRILCFQEEFDLAEEVIKLFTDFSRHGGIFLPGNHEARLAKTLNMHPEFVSLRSLSLNELLHLNKYHVEMIKHGEDYKIGDLYYMHGDEVQGGMVYPARNVYLKENGNLIFGHYHRAQVFYNRLKDGTVHGAWANPCLCELKQCYIKGTSQWQQGFTVVHYYGDLFRVDQIVFFAHDKKLYGCYNGKMYSV